jgi:hypothetical protein
MLRRMLAAMSRAAWILAVALLAATCGDDGGAGPEASARADGPDWAAQFEADPTAALLRAVAQDHEEARRAFGPHRLHTTAEFDLGPTTPIDDNVAPPIDEPVVGVQHVHDEVSLRWASDGTPGHVALQLEQHNDAGRGRDVIVVDDRVYERPAERSWVTYPLESPLWQRWADDAWAAARGIVEFAGPQLAATAAPVPGGGWNGGDAVELTLSRAASLDDERRLQGPTRDWRADVSLEAIGGTVRIDAATGLWLQADVSVDFSVPGADGRRQAGHLVVSGRVEPDSGAAPAPPPTAEPLPERPRLDAEARALLQGLAAPAP